MKHRFLKIHIAMILASALLLCSCAKHKIKENIEAMQSKAVVLDTDNMLCLSNGNADTLRGKTMKFVIYNDSSVCKPCLMAHIADWDDIRHTPACRDVDFYFIFSAQNAEIEKYRKGYNTNDVQIPVFLDTTKVFLNSNPHIPAEWIYHTFLLDKNNKVIFVGDPLHNPNMEELFYTALAQK